MRRLVVGAALAVLMVPLVPWLSSAQGTGCALSGAYRQFTGEISEVGATSLVIEPGAGAPLEFAKSPSIAVMGEKVGWNRLRKGDRVIVSWRMADDPRTAHEICVLAGPRPAS